MVCAAQQDPVAAVVLHSSPADIDMVIVDGVVKKDNGKLKNIDVATAHAKWARNRTTLTWADVAKELRARRKLIAEELARIDMTRAEQGTMKAFYIDPTLLADSV